eukprot:gb/GFBE01055356.1/.p1 GENE.gb/GFBE01055356.1/~~gb/GFBE01055356.1/.p1  ORF type:complete len:651 (+),score=89.76 gb/GFBE01055356.1/:1-1953(+)
MACYIGFRRRRVGFSAKEKGQVRHRRPAARSFEAIPSRSSSPSSDLAALLRDLEPSVEVLAAQVDQLREDHNALRDCLCAVGLLTPSELARQKQCASGFHGFCRTPALVRGVASAAGMQAMAQFSSTSSTASSACRSVVLMNSSLPTAEASAAAALDDSLPEQAPRSDGAGSIFSRLFSASTPAAGSKSIPAARVDAEEGLPTPLDPHVQGSKEAVGAEVATGAADAAVQEPGRSAALPLTAAEAAELCAETAPSASAAANGAALAVHGQAGSNAVQRSLSGRFFARLIGIGWRGEERERPPVSSVMSLKEVVRSIGHIAGATAAFKLCETCRCAAEALRQILPLLSQEAPFIYVCGGSCGIAMDSAERFNPRTGQWETLPSMRMPRRACATASTGGRFYVMGGVDVPRFTDTLCRDGVQQPWVYEDKYRPECFDPVLNRWELLPPMNRPYTHAAATSVGGYVYVFGGLSFGNVLDQAQRFDPVRNQWECLEPMPTPRFECTAASTKGRIFVLGGSNICGEPLSAVECYNPVTGQWKALPNMRQARYGCAAASLKGLVYVFGGHGLWDNLADAEFYDVEHDRWCPLQPMSAQRNHCGAAAAGGRIYVFGGHTNGQDIMTIDCLDPEVGSWEVVALMPKPRSHCMTVTVQP